MSSSTRTPTSGLAGAAAALELPGPEQLTREQLESVYDAFAEAAAASRQDGGDDDDDVAVDADADGVFDAEADDAEVPPTERDLEWWAWCADHVAAAGPCTGDPAVEAGARCHWELQRTLAAERGRTALLEADSACAAQVQRSAAVAAFWGWMAGADVDTRSRVAVVTRERAAITTAQRHVADLRAAEVVVGGAGAAQVRALAVLAPMYAAALDPAVVSALDMTLDLGRLQLLGAVDDLVAEVAPALAWSEYTTTRRVRLAPRMVTLLPATMARLEAGELDLARALMIAERTEAADAAVAGRVDELLCGPGGSGIGLNSAELRDEADKVVATVDAAAVKERSKRKTAARGTRVRKLADGMARLEITGAAPAVTAAHRALTAVAKANRAEAQQAARDGRVAADGGDPYAVPGVDVADPADAGDLQALLADRRTLNAHRFDAAVAALTGARPADGSARPQVGLEVLVTLPGAVGAGKDPGLLVGYGWVPAWLVRQGLSWTGCRVRRVLTDPFTGDLITVDGHTYPASWLHGHDPEAPDGPHDPEAPDGPHGPGPDGSSPRPGPDPGSGSGPAGAGGARGPGGSDPGGGGGPETGSGSSGPGRPDPDTSSASSRGSGTGTGNSSGPCPGPGSGSGGEGAPARFRGLPVQQLPPPRTEDDALGAPLSEEELADLADFAARAVSRGDPADDLDDPCTRGTCVPVDPTDCPLHAIRGGRYLPNTAQARHVRLAWGVCTGPGSTTAAAGCDLDHVIAWRRDRDDKTDRGDRGGGSGGSTCSCNLEPKSRRWHTIKHATDRSTWRNPLDPTGAGVAWTRRWSQWRCDHGSSHWLSPLGRAHHTRPKPIAEPAGPFRRLVAPVAPPPPMLAAHLTSSSRQQQRDDVTPPPFPARPDF